MVIAKRPVSGLESLDVRTIPSDDAEFRRHVREAALEAAAALMPDSLEASVRRSYPDVLVRRQEPIAANGADRVWYVFRDGQFAGGRAEGPGGRADGPAHDGSGSA